MISSILKLVGFCYVAFGHGVANMHNGMEFLFWGVILGTITGRSL